MCGNLVTVTFPVCCMCWHKGPTDHIWYDDMFINSIIIQRRWWALCWDGNWSQFIASRQTIRRPTVQRIEPVTLQALWNRSPWRSFMQGPLPVILPHFWLTPYLHSFRQGQVKRALSRGGGVAICCHFVLASLFHLLFLILLGWSASHCHSVSYYVQLIYSMSIKSPYEQYVGYSVWEWLGVAKPECAEWCIALDPCFTLYLHPPSTTLSGLLTSFHSPSYAFLQIYRL